MPCANHPDHIDIEMTRAERGTSCGMWRNIVPSSTNHDELDIDHLRSMGIYCCEAGRTRCIRPIPRRKMQLPELTCATPLRWPLGLRCFHPNGYRFLSKEGPRRSCLESHSWIALIHLGTDSILSSTDSERCLSMSMNTARLCFICS